MLTSGGEPSQSVSTGSPETQRLASDVPAAHCSARDRSATASWIYHRRRRPRLENCRPQFCTTSLLLHQRTYCFLLICCTQLTDCEAHNTRRFFRSASCGSHHCCSGRRSIQSATAAGKALVLRILRRDVAHAAATCSLQRAEACRDVAVLGQRQEFLCEYREPDGNA